MFRILSVDIAGTGDWTALVGAEVHDNPPRKYRVPMLDRWHDKYTATVDRVVTVATTQPWSDAVLVVDATGVGRPVVELVRAKLPGRRVFGVTFTAGSAVTVGATPLDIRVPKKDLVGAAQVLFQTGRVKINPELKHSDTLVRELLTYTLKITPNLNETYEVGREGANDDLVCGLAMAAWLGEKTPGPTPDARDIVLNVLPADAPEPDRPRSRLETIAEELDLFPKWG